ncbi:50S ribosomal protein L21 [bacterium]|nr:50S ribosomal protein L21 [bacterium]
MTVYAVIETGGKQFKVSHNDIIKIEKIPGEVGEMVDFKEIHLLNIGDELKLEDKDLSNVLVRGRIIAQEKDKKVIVFKFKRRKGYKKKQGHRQQITRVLIKEIFFDSKLLTPEVKKEKVPEETDEKLENSLQEVEKVEETTKGEEEKKLAKKTVKKTTEKAPVVKTKDSTKETKKPSTKSKETKTEKSSPDKPKDEKEE